MNSENFIRLLNENLITNYHLCTGDGQCVVSQHTRTEPQGLIQLRKLCRIGYVVGTLLFFFFCSTMLRVQLYDVMKVYKKKNKKEICALRGFYVA